jgi:hypothetical protein
VVNRRENSGVGSRSAFLCKLVGYRLGTIGQAESSFHGVDEKSEWPESDHWRMLGFEFKNLLIIVLKGSQLSFPPSFCLKPVSAGWFELSYIGQSAFPTRLCYIFTTMILYSVVDCCFHLDGSLRSGCNFVVSNRVDRKSMRGMVFWPSPSHVVQTGMVPPPGSFNKLLLAARLRELGLLLGRI